MQKRTETYQKYEKLIKKYDDNELIRLFLSSRKEIYFQKLYRRYSSKVYAKCISMLKDESLAQDTLQNVFMKVFMNLSTFEGASKFSTWLYSITYNMCIDTLRKRRKEQAFVMKEEQLPEDIEIEDVQDYKILSIKVVRLKKILDLLSASDREVLLMKYREELSIKEISEITNKSPSAVKMKIKRAKFKVVQIYKETFSVDL